MAGDRRGGGERERERERERESEAHSRTVRNVKRFSGQMTIRSPEHNDTFFSSQAEDNHRYARSSLHALYFSFFHEPYVIEAFRVLVEQEETDWHSTSTTNAHIDEALPLLLPPPPPPLPHRAIARKALVSRLIFFYRADLQSSSHGRGWSLPGEE